MQPIVTEGLRKAYDDVVALEDLDLEARQGEVLGFLGPNGAGKSTTIKMLVGLVRPSSGRAFIDGHDVVQEGVQARAALGYVPEVVGLYEQMTGSQLLRYTGRFYGMDRAEATRRSETLLAQVTLEHAADRRVKTYSKGMRQRLALAAALLHEPQVLVLDEPLTGLDPEGVIRMRRAIARLGQDKTIFLSSHELHAVSSLCDRIVIVKEGRVMADAPVEAIIQPDEARVEIELEAPRLDLDTLLSTIEGVREVQQTDEAGRVHTVWLEAIDLVPDLVEALTEAGVRLVRVEPHTGSLEEAFIRIAGVHER